MIEPNIENLRDPFVLVEEDAYYLYGSGTLNTDWENPDWVCYKNDSGKLNGEWEILNKPLYIRPKNAVKNFWAPEVHKYNGSYYMVATYYSCATNHRGCTILKSKFPDGPFEEITEGTITPNDRNCIDGTFYVDKNGQPWMIFVHEWINTDDKTGRMVAAKLSLDLTHFISEPIELFRADEPLWAKNGITDGCFLYTTKDNNLLMIWSNFCESGYCVGIAQSENNMIDGKWIQNEKLLFSKELSKKHDGGHGMIFKDKDGQIYLSVHSPNTSSDNYKEKPIFIPLNEKNGTLICDFTK